MSGCLPDIHLEDPSKKNKKCSALERKFSRLAPVGGLLGTPDTPVSLGTGFHIPMLKLQ